MIKSVRDRLGSLAGQIAVASVVLVVVAVGLCLFDQGEYGAGDHGHDLCAGVIATLAAVVMLGRPLMRTQLLWPAAMQEADAVSPHLPDPPPKF